MITDYSKTTSSFQTLNTALLLSLTSNIFLLFSSFTQNLCKSAACFSLELSDYTILCMYGEHNAIDNEKWYY